MAYETLWDLAATDQLVGKQVKFWGEEHSLLPPRGHVGTVLGSYQDRALVEYIRTDYHDGHPFKRIHVESNFRYLELVK